MNVLCKVGYSLRLSTKSCSQFIGVLLKNKRNYQLPVAMFEGEMKLKKQDNVTLESELIYRVSKSRYLTVLGTVVNVKLIIAPVLLSIVYCERNGKFMMQSEHIMDVLSHGMAFLTEMQCYAVGSVIIILCTALKKYMFLHPLRIYCDKNTTKFTAVFMNSLLPWRIRKYEFSTVKAGFKSIILGEKRAVIREEYFKTQSHLYKLCGHLADNHSEQG